MAGVALFSPVVCAWYAESGDAVVPERVTVALALDKDDITSRTSNRDAVQTVEAELGSSFPAEAITFRRDPVSNSLGPAILAVIRHTDSGFSAEAVIP